MKLGAPMALLAVLAALVLASAWLVVQEQRHGSSTCWTEPASEIRARDLCSRRHGDWLPECNKYARLLVACPDEVTRYRVHYDRAADACRTCAHTKKR